MKALLDAMSAMAMAMWNANPAGGKDGKNAFTVQEKEDYIVTIATEKVKRSPGARYSLAKKTWRTIALVA